MRLLLFRIVVFIGFCLWVQTAAAQQELIRGVKNEPIDITFLSAYAPYVSQDASFGEITLVESPQFNYTLTYSPREDFVGNDQFLLVYFPFGFNLGFTDYRIEVREADLRARHDEASTPARTPVRIPVLANDYASIGTPQLINVPVVNGGTAVIEGSEVVFTPAAGFTGLTDLNYVVCTDGDGDVCDLGTVTINVHPGGANPTDETVQVFTKRDHAQFLFAGSGGTPLIPPVHGVIVDSNGVTAYLPDPGFVGEETVVCLNPATGQETVFEITVLDLDENTYATEDRAYTPSGTPVTLNVLHNDLYTIFGDCIAWSTPNYGTLNPSVTRGEVTYTPPPGWTGVDQFTYTSQPPGCPGTTEEATVYVFVSDFAPEVSIRELVIPAGSVVPITYDVPNGVANWSLETPPQHGAVQESNDGQLIYYAGPGEAGQTDEFNIKYCLVSTGYGTCDRAQSLRVSINISPRTDALGDCAYLECVWPGDTNRDGVVDVGDLLAIGLATGKSGTPRLSANPVEWSGQYTEDWGETLNGIDLKHVDANGDRVISALDTAVVMANLGRAYRLHPEAQTFTTFELSLVGPAEAQPGDLVKLDIVTGTAGTIVEDVYGFRFAFPYNPDGVIENSVEVDFDEDSWLSYDSPIMGLVSDDPSRGVINTAVTRTNLQPISGFGKIGTLSATIVEDVYGFFDVPDNRDSAIVALTFGGGTATTTSAAGYVDAINIQPATIMVRTGAAEDLSITTPEDAADFLDRHLLTFPNPATDQLTIHLNAQQRFTGYQLTDLTGRQVQLKGGLNTNHALLDLSAVPTGLYTLTITTEAGVVNRMIKVR